MSRENLYSVSCENNRLPSGAPYNILNFHYGILPQSQVFPNLGSRQKLTLLLGYELLK